MSDHHAKQSAFPLGHAISLGQLDRDPNRVYAELRRNEPVSWVSCTGSWFLTRHRDILQVLRDAERFTVADPNSLLSIIFGKQILSIDGNEHRRQRLALNPSFTPKALRETLTHKITGRAESLIGKLTHSHVIELRSSFASRYPVQNILDFFGIADRLEPSMRQWYDSFEKALSNFKHDPAIEAHAKKNVGHFMDMLQQQLAGENHSEFLTVLSSIADMSTEDTCRNALTIFFGGISTVEALILNATWSLCADKHLMQRVLDDRSLIKPLLEETMRWASPVQSSIRIATENTAINGIAIAKGDRVACMLGAANRDPELWENPDDFDIDRRNLARHIGFSSGSHFCLGSHLARLEAEIAIDLLLETLPGLSFNPELASAITGYEFRQPRELHLVWDKN